MSKTYMNAADLLRDCTDDASLAEELKTQIASRQLIRYLAMARDRKKVTQAQVAQARGCQQGAISKLENGVDADLTLRDIQAYHKAVGVTVDIVVFESPPTLIERVKWHAHQISECFKELRAAASNKQLVKDIATFHIEALMNLTSVVKTSLKKLTGKRSAEDGIEIKTVGEPPKPLKIHNKKDAVSC